MMWMRAPAPGMPFTQCVSVPIVQTLRTTREGIRLASQPVRELEQLRAANPISIKDKLLRQGEDLLDGVGKEGVDIVLEVDIMKSKGFDLIVEGLPDSL